MVWDKAFFLLQCAIKALWPGMQHTAGERWQTPACAVDAKAKRILYSKAKYTTSTAGNSSSNWSYERKDKHSFLRVLSLPVQLKHV